jgi:hypothetical protein
MAGAALDSLAPPVSASTAGGCSTAGGASGDPPVTVPVLVIAPGCSAAPAGGELAAAGAPSALPPVGPLPAKTADPLTMTNGVVPLLALAPEAPVPRTAVPTVVAGTVETVVDGDLGLGVTLVLPDLVPESVEVADDDADCDAPVASVAGLLVFAAEISSEEDCAGASGRAAGAGVEIVMTSAIGIVTTLIEALNTSIDRASNCSSAERNSEKPLLNAAENGVDALFSDP